MSQDPIPHFMRRGLAPLLVLILLAGPAVAAGSEKSRSPLRKPRPHEGLALIPAEAGDDAVGLLDLKPASVAIGQGTKHSVESRKASVKQQAEHTSQLQAYHGSRGTATWWVLGALAVFVPVLVAAGCMSLSNQVDSPGMVAGCVAVVFGKMSGRRQTPRQTQAEGARSWRKPPDSAAAEASEGAPKSYGGWRRPGPWGVWQTKGEEQRPTSAHDSRVPSRVPTQTMSGQTSGAASASDTTQYRQWEAPASSNPRVYVQQEKRVHFMGASPFPGVPSAPQDVPVHCAPPKPVSGGAGSERSVPEERPAPVFGGPSSRDPAPATHGAGDATAQRSDY